MNEKDKREDTNILRVVIGVYVLIVAFAVPVSVISNWPQVHTYGYAWLISGAVLEGVLLPGTTYLVALGLLSAIVYVFWPRG